MKKFLAILLTLTVVLGLCAGCGSQTGNKGGVGADGKVTLHIGIPADAMVMDVENNALTDWVEEQMNVNLEFTVYPGGTDIATQITSTVFANQELPDILIGIPLEDETIADFGHDEYFVDLSDYFADKEGASKNFWERMEACLTEDEQEYVVSSMTDADTGEIYVVPTIETSLIDSMYYMPWINVEWLDKLGMEKPTTNQELYDFLKAVSTTDLNGDGKTEDQIPLLGSQKSQYGTRVVDWLINLFTYYHSQHKWQPDENGKMYNVMASDAYREGMKYVRKLYAEGLLSNMIYTTGDSDMKNIATPASGVASCGIFVGHLSVHAMPENDILYQYEPLQTWGSCAQKDINYKGVTFITSDCDNVDKAFELLMLLWSEDGAMRQRYGEYGVNWEDADEGAKSLMGLDATYKLYSDPYMVQSTANWGSSCGLNHYAEGETAQTPDDATEWTKHKNSLHAEARKLWDEASEKNNPEKICPILKTTTEEQEATEVVRTNVNSYLTECEKNFIIGEMDIFDDAVWKAYLDELDKLGYDEYQKYVQTAYERS